MDDQCFIHFFSHCYIAVGKVILFKAIQIMGNWRFFLDPSQPIPNSHFIFIVIFIIFVFFFFLECTFPLFFTLRPFYPSRQISVFLFLQILSVYEMIERCADWHLPLCILCILSSYLKPKTRN